MRTLFILMVGVVAVVSCTHSDKGSSMPVGQTISITPDTAAVMLGDYFKQERVIELKDAIIGSIENVLIANDILIVQGSSDRGELLFFSPDGSFLSNPIKIGRGPNEALNIFDIALDEAQNKLLVLTDFGRQIIEYSLSDNKITDRISLPETYIARNIEKLDEDRFVLYKDLSYSDQDEYKISIFNKKTGLIESNHLPLDKQAAEYISFIQRNNLFTDKGDVMFYEVFADTVYRVSTTQLDRAYAFDKADKAMPSDKLYAPYGDVMELVSYCKGSPYIWAHTNCYKCGDYLISQYAYENDEYFNISNTITGKSKSGLKIMDNVMTGGELIPNNFRIVGSDSNRLYVVYPKGLSDDQSQDPYATSIGLLLAK